MSINTIPNSAPTHFYIVGIYNVCIDTELYGYGVAHVRAFVSSLNQSEFLKFKALIVCVGTFQYTNNRAFHV